jgi:hypothetical protein
VNRRLASALAVIGGFILTAASSSIADALMYGTGVFPSGIHPMAGYLFAVAAAYRALFAIAGGYLTARLAPDRPMLHAWVLAGIGLTAGLGGVVAQLMMGPAKLGPTWYPVLVGAEAIPCVYLGARLALLRRGGAAT